MDALEHADEETMTSIDSIGPKIAESVFTFFRHDKNRKLVESLRNAGLQFESSGTESVSELLSDKKFVLTGTLPSLSRNDASSLIEKHGGSTASSVSKNTDFVLAGESAGSKLDKAKKLGITVINEEEFLKMIGEN